MYSDGKKIKKIKNKIKKKWYWWTYLQGRNREADIEKRVVDTVGKGEGGMKWGSNTETYTWPCSHR